VDLRFGSGAWLVTQAAHGDEEAFRQLTAPYRRELQLHCYRMLGSMHDAEDALQETMLGAWRRLERFERRASVRAWLYRIATNRCLDALRDAGRRPRPSQAPAFQPPSPTRFAELTWIKPYPDVLLEGLIDTAPGPAARYQTRETIELAFITALQALPPRQRAVLVLRDVLGYHATEVGRHARLKRRRGQKRTEASARDARPAPRRARPRQTTSRRLAVRTRDRAAVRRRVGGRRHRRIVALLTEDAWLTIPPSPLEYQGVEAIGAFPAALAAWRSPQQLRLVPARANTQPAFGVYGSDPQSAIAHARGLLVVTLAGDRVTTITQFLDTGVLAGFGLPRTLPI
jgi:RNA polymerase sigma-70 factor (TIGR02960 family)